MSIVDHSLLLRPNALRLASNAVVHRIIAFYRFIKRRFGSALKELPRTPADALEVSTYSLLIKVRLIVFVATLCSYWKYPSKEAATAVEEMTLKDVYYWLYKCRRPMKRREKGSGAPYPSLTEKQDLGLPSGFVKEASLSLSAVGDLFYAPCIENSKDILYQNVSDLIFECDISIANLESPLTTQALHKEVISDKGPPIEGCWRTHLDILTSHMGKYFSVLNLANNHICDRGQEGLALTCSTLSKRNILALGVTPFEAQEGSYQVNDNKGIKLGFVSSTFSLNGRDLNGSNSYRVNQSKLLSKYVDAELDHLRNQIDDCKTRGCDFIICNLHWGYEFEFFPRLQQITAAHQLAEYGADAILCHHPHVIQPIEYYQTKRDINRRVLIAYSLGSLVWGYTAPHLALSMILVLHLAKGQYNHQKITYIENAVATPVFRRHFIEDNKMLTRIEKLSNHLDGQDKTHFRKYINIMCSYIRLVS